MRTTVLDQFTSDEWRPSPAQPAQQEQRLGDLPRRAGPGGGHRGSDRHLEVLPRPELRDRLAAAALPGAAAPDRRRAAGASTPARSTSPTSTARHPTPLSYSVTAFTPDLSQTALRTSLRAPCLDPEADDRRCPATCPQVIRTQAEKVTKGAKSDFDKAVALQDWFRTGGGFTYSLDQRGGLRDGPARALRHRRPGRLLRAVRLRDGRHGPCPRDPFPRGGRLPRRAVAARRPDPLHQRRAARLAGDVLPRLGLGALRADPGTARGLRPAVHPEPERHPDPDPGPDLRTLEAPRSQARRAAPGRHHQGQLVVLGALAAGGRGAGPRAPADRAGRAAAGAAAAPAGLAATRCTSPRGPGPSWAPPPWTSGWTGPSTAPRASRPDGSPPRWRPDPRRSRHSRACWARSSAAATPRRPRSPTIEPDDRSRTVQTLDSWRHAMGASVEHPWRARLWPRSLWRRG